jgi:hypothetical protein
MQHVSRIVGDYNRCGIISQNLTLYQRYCEVFKIRKFENINTKHEMHAKSWEEKDVKLVYHYMMEPHDKGRRRSKLLMNAAVKLQTKEMNHSLNILPHYQRLHNF